MGEHRGFDTLVLVFVFFLPAVVSLYFAWSVWIANTRPAIAGWRRIAFQCGLIAALLTVALLGASSIDLVRTLRPAQGVWLLGNWFAAVLWVAALGAACAGKGWGRVLLLCWGILIFLGVFGLQSAMIP